MSSFTVALMVESPPVLVFYTSTACGATVPHCARNRTGLFACVSKLANWVRQSQRPSADEYFPSLCWLVHQIIPIDVMLVQVPDRVGTTSSRCSSHTTATNLGTFTRTRSRHDALVSEVILHALPGDDPSSVLPLSTSTCRVDCNRVCMRGQSREHFH